MFKISGKKLAALFFLALTGICFAEDRSVARPPSVLTISEAIQFGLDHYPSLKVAAGRISASKSGVDLARTAYLPRANLGFQENRATFNNVPGLILSNPFTQSISGGAIPGRNSMDSAWGSSTGLMVAWEPFDFGLRAANVETAEASRRLAQAGANLTQLEVAVGVGEAFFELLLLQENVKTLKADVARRNVFVNIVSVLARTGLRPGVEESRARTELAIAQTRLVQTEQAEAVARTRLAETLGIAGEPIEIKADPLLQAPGAKTLREKPLDEHPLAEAQKAAIDVSRLRKEALDYKWVPKFDLQGGVFARGTGWDTLGNNLSGARGLGPETANWAFGLSVVFPLFDFASTRAERSIERHNEETERARYEQLSQELKGKNAKARAIIDGALRIAEITPKQVSFAKDTETQSVAQYQAGLANGIEVSEAQRLLTQASIEDALARLGVWRSLLGAAGANGDLRPFLDLVALSAGKGR